MTDAPGQEVVGVTAADENYAAPLAVSVRSAIDTLAPDRRLRLFVLDGGIGAESQENLLRSWDDPRVRVEWLRYDGDALAALPSSGHLTTATYLRLVLPEILPSSVGKVVFFDSDVLVRRDLGELFDEPLGDHLALGAQETTAPWIDSELVSGQQRPHARHVAALRPVANYRELGMRPDAPYLNAGVLVFDAEQWRRERMCSRLFDCIEEHKEHLLWLDQYALNVVLYDRWRAVDQRWNQTAGLFRYPTWRESPLDQHQFKRLASDPWIVHFSSQLKPWNYFCDHPFRGEYYQTLDRTAWRGWRPATPANVLPMGWKFYRRKFKAAVRTWVGTAVNQLSPAA